MATSILIAIVLLIVALGGIFSYRVSAAYSAIGSYVAALCVLLLFLAAIGVIHL